MVIDIPSGTCVNCYSCPILLHVIKTAEFPINTSTIASHFCTGKMKHFEDRFKELMN